jgi:hypothetical protein
MTKMNMFLFREERTRIYVYIIIDDLYIFYLRPCKETNYEVIIKLNIIAIFILQFMML